MLNYSFAVEVISFSSEYFENYTGIENKTDILL